MSKIGLSNTPFAKALNTQADLFKNSRESAQVDFVCVDANSIRPILLQDV